MAGCGELVQFWTRLSSGRTIARPGLKGGREPPKCRVSRPTGGELAGTMEVDRVSQMGGVGQEQTPSWTRSKMRRRKFAEEAEPAETEEQEAQNEPEAERRASSDEEPRTLDLMA